ncbi:hypothetical protein BDV96DRAFT_649085 [Lophiotrema nucula]|uniref:Uncharacterized protein n=1 Tax=Lophiotrema nucula TaxID=690887 RepID=A0A6A5YYP6_9PLEO|nr:hypothetical protein BDV96DRAFT_649085 [Lophiotrema nucula]
MYYTTPHRRIGRIDQGPQPSAADIYPGHSPEVGFAGGMAAPTIASCTSPSCATMWPSLSKFEEIKALVWRHFFSSNFSKDDKDETSSPTREEKASRPSRFGASRTTQKRPMSRCTNDLGILEDAVKVLELLRKVRGKLANPVTRDENGNVKMRFPRSVGLSPAHGPVESDAEKARKTELLRQKLEAFKANEAKEGYLVQMYKVT